MSCRGKKSWYLAGSLLQFVGMLCVQMVGTQMRLLNMHEQNIIIMQTSACGILDLLSILTSI
jgi:hypothetical protein